MQGKKTVFIHFAFAGLKDDVTAQTKAVITKIFDRKRLKFSINPEFIPVFQPHLHSKFKGKRVGQIALESFKPTQNGVEASIDELRLIKPENDIHFLPYEVRMLCFIKTSLKKIGNSPHYKQYGRFGIVLTDTFLKRKGIKAVHYYEESSLFTDPLITNWNLKYAYKSDLNAAEISKKHDLETQILAFRKPANLFESFRESRLLALKKAEGQIDMKIIDAYDRYSIGYDFREEKEWRIVSHSEDFLSFSENEFFMVIVPDAGCKSALQNYFDENWKKIPQIEAFPST